MDGKELLYRLRQLLSEESDSTWMDNKTSYDFINEAANQFAQDSKLLQTSQSITTVVDQTDYTLNADFIEIATRNKSGKAYIKYNNGTNHFITWKDYTDIVQSDNTSSVAVPDRFTIINDDSLDSRLTGTTTSAGAISGGEANLIDSGADFSDVSPFDIVHNTTDGSDGIVISKTSNTQLVCALFNGTNNDFTSGDSYVIQPQGKLKLVLDPPPSVAGDTITVYYINRPAPVYSDYSVFKFPSQYITAIIKYAAWLYKYRDREPNFGDAWFVHWDKEVKRAGNTGAGSLGRKKITFNFKNRRDG